MVNQKENKNRKVFNKNIKKVNEKKLTKNIVENEDVIISSKISFYLKFMLEKINDITQEQKANIYNKIQKACSTVNFIINDKKSICSGSFISLSENDLKNGLFMTAAHCVMKVIENDVIKTTELYITNPLTNNYYSVDINNIYYDGIADVAIIKTDIDFTNNPDIPLKLSKTVSETGDICYICGNPGGYDNLSISGGHIRDANYNMPSGISATNNLLISAPGIGGNSGSPILNNEGEIIGIYTWGYTKSNQLSGGANLEVLNSTLPVLAQFPISKRNITKNFLGLWWQTPSPFYLQNYYPSKKFPNKGLFINGINNEFSPFENLLQLKDIILSATIGDKTINFGEQIDQFTLGVLYYQTEKNISLNVRRGTYTIIVKLVLNKTYADVPDYYDIPLSTGLPLSKEAEKIKSKILKTN